MINNSRSIRELILGNRNIEGVWVDTVFDENDQIIGGGIVNIKFEKSTARIDGINYSYDNSNQTCKRSSSFYSTMANFADHTLEFTYLYRNKEENYHAPGYGRFDFLFNNNGKFNEYEGYFFVSNSNTKRTVISKRIIDSQTLLNIDKDKIKRDIIINQIKTFTN